MLYIDQNEFRYVSKLGTIMEVVLLISGGLVGVLLFFLAAVLDVDSENEPLIRLVGALFIITFTVMIVSSLVVTIETGKKYTIKIEDNTELICKFNEQTVTIKLPCEMKQIANNKKKGKIEFVLDGCIKVCSTDKDANGRTVEEFLERVVKKLINDFLKIKKSKTPIKITLFLLEFYFF